ncbi:MAG: membrane protein insertase YidC [Gammaproteobacteria bacterium]|nr:membrane protein insertase YidC [Gammaproteobacteria bacterium]
MFEKIGRQMLWITFVFSLVLLWDQWKMYRGEPATFFPVNNPASLKSADTRLESPPSNQAVPIDAKIHNSALPVNTGHRPEQMMRVQTDVLALTFSSIGGAIKEVALLKHFDKRGEPLLLLEESKNRTYLAQSGLIGEGNQNYPTHKTPMRMLTTDTQLAPNENILKVQFASDALNGLELIVTYTLTRGEYTVQVQHEIINRSQQVVSPQLYSQLVRDGGKLAEDSAFYSTYTGPAIYTDNKKFQKIEFSDIESGKAQFDKSATVGYISMIQHYFASAWWFTHADKREFYARKVASNLYSVGMIADIGKLEPESKQSITSRLYLGPQEEKVLEALYPGLELVKDYGWLTIIAKPLYWLLDWLHQYLNNWGWAIMALVLTLKILFYWLNSYAYRSMAKMKVLAPKMTELRERHKGEPQKMQVELMNLYRQEKINPMGGCLPIFVQIPVFIALYWVLLATVEMRGASWLWVSDLSTTSILELIEGNWRKVYWVDFILPVLLTLSSVLQTWLNPTPPDPLQAKLMWIMPLAFSVMFFVFPAGLVLYWLTNNILSIAQQWNINRGIQAKA